MRTDRRERGAAVARLRPLLPLLAVVSLSPGRPGAGDGASSSARGDGAADPDRSPRRRHCGQPAGLGAPLRPMRWWLALSLRRYSFDRVARARRHVRTAREKRRAGGQVLHVVVHAAAAVLLAPKVALYVGAYPAFRARASRVWRRAPTRVGQCGTLSPITAGYLGQTEAWSDGWVGPRLAVTREIERETRMVWVAGSADLQHMTKPLILTVRLNGRAIGRHRVREPGVSSCEFLSRILFLPGCTRWTSRRAHGSCPIVRRETAICGRLRGGSARSSWTASRTDEAHVDRAHVTTALAPSPRVGIAVPSLDQGRFLGEALDSVFMQAGVEVRVAVLDAGSRRFSRGDPAGRVPLAYWRSRPTPARRRRSTRASRASPGRGT